MGSTQPGGRSKSEVELLTHTHTHLDRLMIVGSFYLEGVNVWKPAAALRSPSSLSALPVTFHLSVAALGAQKPEIKYIIWL